MTPDQKRDLFSFCGMNRARAGAHYKRLAGAAAACCQIRAGVQTLDTERWPDLSQLTEDEVAALNAGRWPAGW